MMFRTQKRSSNSSTPCSPQESDILCGKDKTYAKHTGNRLFRERIDALKVSYKHAQSKQEKMALTKEIVTYMHGEHGSRFLKMEGKVWVEINNQAARDKVSHALRFAAKNLKPSSSLSDSAKSSTKAKQLEPARDQHTQCDDSVSSESVASSNQSGSNERTENNNDEPVPLSQVFGQDSAINIASFEPFGLHDAVARFGGFLPDYPSAPFGGMLPEYPNAPHVCAAKSPDEELVAKASQSLRSLQLDEEREDGETEKLDTLRSEDLNAIMDEQFDGDEWEIMKRIVES